MHPYTDILPISSPHYLPIPPIHPFHQKRLVKSESDTHTSGCRFIRNCRKDSNLAIISVPKLERSKRAGLFHAISGIPMKHTCCKATQKERVREILKVKIFNAYRLASSALSKKHIKACLFHLSSS